MASSSSTMNDGLEDTEWNDVLREKGILPPKPKELEMTEEQIIAMVESSVNERLHGKPIEDRTLDELSDLEDLEDDRVLESYRRKRLAEMQGELALEKYNRVYQITKSEYTAQVTEASQGNDAWVVVHMFQEYNPGCRRLNAIMDRLATRHRAVKFCKIVADLCVPGYPDCNLPTLLVYGRGDLQRQEIGMRMLGGETSATEETVEAFLRSVGVSTLSARAANNSGRRQDCDDDDEANMGGLGSSHRGIRGAKSLVTDGDDDLSD